MELTVDGLVDTGIVYCVIPCEGLSNSVYCHRTEDGAAYYVVKGNAFVGYTNTFNVNLAPVFNFEQHQLSMIFFVHRGYYRSGSKEYPQSMF